MPRKIDRADSGKIVITGVETLKGSNYTPIYDRIEAGTFMIAAAITKSKIKVIGAKSDRSHVVL